MAVDVDAFGDWGKEVPAAAPGDDHPFFCKLRVADLRVAHAALLNMLQRLGDYPEGPLLEMHAAADRLKASIIRIQELQAEEAELFRKLCQRADK